MLVVPVSTGLHAGNYPVTYFLEWTKINVEKTLRNVNLHSAETCKYHIGHCLTNTYHSVQAISVALQRLGTTYSRTEPPISWLEVPDGCLTILMAGKPANAGFNADDKLLRTRLPIKRQSIMAQEVPS